MQARLQKAQGSRKSQVREGQADKPPSFATCRSCLRGRYNADAAMRQCQPGPASNSACPHHEPRWHSSAHPPHLWHIQGVSGWFAVSPLPNGCASVAIRAVTGQIQMQKRTDRSVWLNVGAKNGNIRWKGTQFFQLVYGPSHAWPNYLFNECVGGRGWLKVRGMSAHRQDEEREHPQGARRTSLYIPSQGSRQLQVGLLQQTATAYYKNEWGNSGSG